MSAATKAVLRESERDAASQRSIAASSSARSLLYTVLGEFVLPWGAPAWTGALIDSLGVMGVEEKAARQALARAATEGLLTSERVGRRTRWDLTESSRRLLEEGARRIYGFMRESPSWDGRWLILAITVPESQRALRHRLRTRLTWAGMGSPAPGLWVLPHSDRAEEIAAILSDLGIEGRAMSWLGESGDIGKPADVVAAAWSSLSDVEAEYEKFMRDFGKRRAPRTDGDAFAGQVELVQAWRRFPFIDPGLPAALLESNWPGPKAAEVFHRLHDEWHGLAQRHWAELQEQSGP